MTLANYLKAAAGNAGAGNPYIEDVFSTWLYTGNGSTQTITNGIDLSGEGGLVWIKGRSGSPSHQLTDTERGTNSQLSTNNTGSASGNTNYVTSFNALGFSIGNASDINTNAQTYASWTFRKQPKFFDVVTYTGNGTTQNISHNLGSVPGCIIVKRINSASNTGWPVYHRFDYQQHGFLNLTNGFNGAQEETWFGNNLISVAPTSTVFTVGSNQDINANTNTYVAYLFAHDAGGFGDDGSDNVISCGSLTTDGGGLSTVTLGYEPQFVIMKDTGGAGEDWILLDTMRGWVNASGPNDALLRPNLSEAEVTVARGNPTATGFQAAGLAGSAPYIYIAIRRPMTPPESGTSVFAPVAYTGNSTTRSLSTGFPVDLAFVKARTPGGTGSAVVDRLRGASQVLQFEGTNAEFLDAQTINGLALQSAVQIGTHSSVNGSGTTFILESFRRAPGFFDVVCYTGDGTVGRAIPHNLSVIPEMIILKGRNTNSSWLVYNKDYNGGVNAYQYFQTLNGINAVAGPVSVYTQSPTASAFYVDSASNTANGSGTNTVAYLFASCPGVSKVFSYTGNGSSQTINCGFTGGARFVLIKRTDSTGDWYVWDTARGMVAGNDPHLSLNTTAAEVTTDDSVDTASTGFIVNQVAATNVNVSSATYIGVAIA